MTVTDRQELFRNPDAPLGKRVDDLLSRLTLGERISLLHQYAPAVPRLGIAAFRTGQEAPHGVARSGHATVFPQAVGLGATWNDDLVRRVGEAVGTEARAMRLGDDRVSLTVRAPAVNPLRHPLWGRNEEGYAEDPKLTAALATAYARGLRGDHPAHWRTAPVLTHWLAHDNETAGGTSSASVRPRVLHEYDLRAFRAPVEAGAVACVTPARGLVNGRPHHVSPHLAEHLRAWTDEDLLVCSAAGAPSDLVDAQGYFDTYEEAVAAALVAGVDSFTDHGADAAPTTDRLRRALEQGLLSEADIDRAARRHLGVRFRLGEFDPEPGPYADASTLGSDTPAHRALAREAAEQALVLLKNDGLLPLAEGTRIAVVGLPADACGTDGHSGTPPHRVTPLDGLRARFGAEHVTFAEGTDRVRLRCAAGWLRVCASVTDDDAPSGADEPLDPAPHPGRTGQPPLTVAVGAADATEFALADWGQGVCTLRAPDGRHLSVADDRLVRVSAVEPGGRGVLETFTPEETFTPVGHEGGCLLQHRATGGYVSFAADGVKAADKDELSELSELSAPFESFEPFKIEYVERGEQAVARAAASADTVIVVAGNAPHINGRETEDRTTLALPEHQRRLWRAARAANPRTVLILVSSYPYAVVDADADLPALLWSAHGGQAAGTALARVLAGDVCAAGRLPQTWYACDDDLPDLLDHDVIGSRQTYLYFDAGALYPFGHGLSYSTFGYDALTVVREGAVLKVGFTVTNTGTVDADEVAQLYARAVDVSPVARPRRQLVGHRRLHLAAGAARRVAFDVPVAELGLWDVVRERWSVPGGTYQLQAGASSEDIRLTGAVEIDGEPSAARPVQGTGLAADAYDEQCGTEIVDRTKTCGDAVTALGGAEGELLYRDCDFGPPLSLSDPAADASAAATAGVTVEAALGGSVHLGAGHTTATLTFAPGGDAYAYTTRSIAFPVAGVRDLRVRLRGPVRLARLTFHGAGSPSIPTQRTPSR